MSERVAAVAESEAFARAPVAYSILDLEGNQVAANDAFRELFRLDDESVNVENLTHEGDRERTAVYLDLLRSGARDRVVVDKRYVRGDGTIFWGRLTAGTLLDDTGRPVYLVGIIEDVTTQIDALARLNAASDAKSGFVARVSHDLRTPLHAIRGLAELLALAELDERQQKFVTAIEREADTLRALVDDLLDLSRLEAGRLELKPGAFAFGSCLRGAVEVLATRAEEKGLTLELTMTPETDRRAWGDGDRLRQVLVNLIDNAIKFTSSGSVRVSARAGERDEVIVTVRDSGVGIAPEDIERIFEPFGRAHPDQTGTGLGLTISKDLIAAMGGSLTVDSTLGRGSVFTIKVPLPPTIGGDEPAGHESLGGDTRPHRPHVLVVEDSPINQLLAAAQLDQIGCRHQIAATGAAALDAFARGHFDLVLMDWHLPDMDGLETTARLRRAEAEQGMERTPVVAVTARAMTGDRERCLDAGMDDFLAKPVSVADLARVVRQWVSRDLPAEKQPAPAAVGDTDAIDRLVDDLGDAAIVASLVTTFLAELPGRCDAIVEGAGSGDNEAVWRAAHTLKSTCAMLGATDLASIAEQLEARARAGEGELDSLVEALDAAADRVTAELSATIDRLEQT